MIYAIVILSVALILVYILYINEQKVSAGHKSISDLKLQLCEISNKKIDELEKDIYDLVEGGMIQRETVETKYKEKYKRERDMQNMALHAHKLQAARYSGLPSLGGFYTE